MSRTAASAPKPELENQLSPAIPTGPPSEVIRENAIIKCQFNVMPGLDVSETLIVHEYRIWDGYVEATFDRTYESAMKKSPSHLIFLTALVHAQKAAYLAACRHFGRTYASGEAEFCKFWWTDVQVEIPKLIRREEDLVQKLWLTNCRPTGEASYQMNLLTTFCDSLTIRGSAPMFLV